MDICAQKPPSGMCGKVIHNGDVFSMRIKVNGFNNKSSKKLSIVKFFNLIFGNNAQKKERPDI
jgi:hypothetical protein